LIIHAALKDYAMRLALLTAFLLLTPAPSFAQSKDATIPDVPEALQALAERGAQMRYLGSEHGLQGWIAIYQGQEQYYYVTPDKKAFVTGLMFAQDGRPITIDQVRELQAQGGPALDLLAEAEAPAEVQTPPPTIAEAARAQTPAERMFKDVENSNWITLGQSSAPVVYSFIDPQCPHCHEFLKEAKPGYLDSGLLQIRIVPVGFQESSLAQASFLLAAPDGAAKLYQHLAGDTNALPAKSDISTQAVQKNMALMQAWKFNVTPLTVYRAASGEVKIVRGKPKDLPGLLADLGASSTAKPN
jgi:thiol:disulfide interchange protein DsbG